MLGKLLIAAAALATAFALISVPAEAGCTDSSATARGLHQDDVIGRTRTG